MDLQASLFGKVTRLMVIHEGLCVKYMMNAALLLNMAY